MGREWNHRDRGGHRLKVYRKGALYESDHGRPFASHQL